MATGRREAERSSEEPLPRPVRKRRRPRDEMGLPADAELAALAQAYLVQARELWPELAKAGLLPRPATSVIEALVDDFKTRRRSGTLEPDRLTRYAKRSLELAANYPRYSDDNSDPKSIRDQLALALRRAKTDGRFIPWELIVADYGRSAMHGHRQGFSTLLALVGQTDLPIAAVYIDDFQRGSRNEVDSWKLAGSCKRRDVRLIGVSDGFSIEGEDWDGKVAMFNFFTRMDNGFKRQRVRRGMLGAAAENRSLGKLPLGYTRRVKRNAAGVVETKPDGRPKHERCLDPATKDAAYRIFQMYCEQKLTPHRITRQLNHERVEGWDGWTEKAVREMLVNPSYIGLFIWNRERQETDPATGRQELVSNPWKQWRWHYDRELALIPKSWHVYARQRLEKSRRRRGPRRAPDRAATTLFSGTLFCGFCGGKIKLNRSAGKDKCMACMDGLCGRRGCQLTSSKSVRIIETALLRFIAEHLLTEKRLTALVKQCNDSLAAEKRRPRQDLQPLQRQEKQLAAELGKLLDRISRTDDEALCQAYEQRIGQLQQAVNAVRTSLHEAQRRDAPPPAKLGMGQVKKYLADLRGLLQDEIPAAAEALRALTGPISITQKRYESGKPGAEWFATFTPDLLELLGKEARRLGYPDSGTWELLRTRKWIVPEEVKLPLDPPPRCQQRAAECLRLRQQGLSLNAIAAATGLAWEAVQHALQFAATGQRPKHRPGKPRPRALRPVPAAPGVPKYQRFSQLALQLYEVEGKTHAAIRTQIRREFDVEISEGTVVRAIAHGRRAAVS